MRLEADIRKDFGGFCLDMHFASDAGHIGILGASGCGKSMTLRCIAGIVTPDEGRIVLNGRVLFDSEKHINLKPQQRHVGYLFQNYALFPNMTVEQNIRSGLHGIKKEEQNARVQEMIEKFALQGLEKHFPDQLSGGQQQRTALARIMAYSPDVILLDEPFSALDAYLRDRVQQETLDLLKEYTGIAVLVSHNRDEVYRFSEDLLILDHGSIEVHGTPKAVFADPRTKAAAVLTGCKNFSSAVRVDDHTVKAESWGIMLHSDNLLPEDFSYLGFRAHDFIPIYGERKENCIVAKGADESSLPFENNFYIPPENRKNYEREDVITWLVQRKDWPILQEKGMPDYLQFDMSRMLYLKDPEVR